MQASDFKNLGIKPFNKGLSDLGNNLYCYLQLDEERLAVNFNSLYREYRGEEQREDHSLFEQMAELSGFDG